MHGRSADTSLAEIHQGMSELLDKQVNENFKKNFHCSHKLPQVHIKVCDKNESRIRKMLLMEGTTL